MNKNTIALAVIAAIPCVANASMRVEVTDGIELSQEDYPQYRRYYAKDGSYCTSTVVNPYVSITTNHCKDATRLYGEVDVTYNMERLWLDSIADGVYREESVDFLHKIVKHQRFDVRKTTPLYLGNESPVQVGDIVRMYGHGKNKTGSHTFNKMVGHIGEIIPVGYQKNFCEGQYDANYPTNGSFCVGADVFSLDGAETGKVYEIHTWEDIGDTEGGDSGSAYTAIVDGVESIVSFHTNGANTNGSHGPISWATWDAAFRSVVLDEINGLSYPGVAEEGQAITIQNLSPEVISLLPTEKGTCGDTLAPTELCTMVMPEGFTEYVISGESHEQYDYVIYAQQADEPVEPVGSAPTDPVNPDQPGGGETSSGGSIGILAMLVTGLVAARRRFA